MIRGLLGQLPYAIAVGALCAVAAFGSPPDEPDEDRAAKRWDGVVAYVGSEGISRADFNHWLAVAAASDPGPGGSKAVPRRGTPRYHRLRDQVMELLIRQEWIEGEAAARGVSVSRAEVQRSFESQKDESFTTEREYRRFLRQSRQTEADVLMRVKLDLLSNRIRDRVVAGAGGKVAEKRALDRFVRQFRKRWRARTECARGYVMSDCARGG